jgi:hypothetical protein
VNHLGCLKLADDAAEKEAQIAEWRAGLQALAGAGPHVYLKISMLCYADANWDHPASCVRSLVHEALALLRPQRADLAKLGIYLFMLTRLFFLYLPKLHVCNQLPGGSFVRLAQGSLVLRIQE